MSDLMHLIDVHQGIKRQVYRKWIRAELTEEMAGLLVAGEVARSVAHPDSKAPVQESTEPLPEVPGYDPTFLGFPVPLPRLVLASTPAAVLLHYPHFSVLLNPARRMAWFAAVNADYRARLKDDDEIDWERWKVEPRVPPGQQLDEKLFPGSVFDHSRLVKRMMPAWGEPKLAGVAFGATGHFTNLMPLMAEVNQNPIWRALPDHILKHHAHQQRMSFFSGPLFTDNDPEFRGVRIPAVCWMVFAYADHIGRPTSAAFLTAQLAVERSGKLEAPLFLTGLPTTPQVTRIPLNKLLQIGGLDFGVLHDFDVSQSEYPFRYKNELPGTPVTSLKVAIPQTAPHGNITRSANQLRRPSKLKRLKKATRVKRALARHK